MSELHDITAGEIEMKRTERLNAGTAKAAKVNTIDHEARVLEMAVPHQRAYEEIRKLLDDQRHGKAAAWYAVGQKVVKITADSTYGKKAVAKIAEALGWDASLLYAAGRVAKRWSSQAFKKVLSRRDDVRGNRLSWSHFVELERVVDPKQCDLLIEQTLSEGLSVRDLKRTIDNPQPKEAPENSQPTSAAKALRSFKAARETIVEKAARDKGALFDVLDADMEAPNGGELGTPIMLKLLKDAHAVQLQASELLAKQLTRLDAYITRATELQGATQDALSGDAPTIHDKLEGDNNG